MMAGRKSSMPIAVVRIMIDRWIFVHAKYQETTDTPGSEGMPKSMSKLRALLKARTFLQMPAVYNPIGARLVERAGSEATYAGGYVTSGSRTITEPLLTMTEQVETAEAVAASIELPVVVDGGAGFGELLHCMCTVRESSAPASSASMSRIC
jgi:2-methylisocitrate lyase-like PEP mutase family enzyme